MNKIINNLKVLCLDIIQKANSGHPGMALGVGECLFILFTKYLNINPNEPEHFQRDRFILSNGHISPVLYSILARTGHFDLDELNTFRKIDSRLQGHPTNHDNLPGINISSGSLGQGLSVGIGIGLSKKLNNDKSLVYVLTGDGELQEGQNWEALMFGAAKEVDNIIVTVDFNGQQIDGSTKDVLDIGDLDKKLESFGWEVLKIENGNSLDEVLDTYRKFKTEVKDDDEIILLNKKQSF